MSDRMVSCVRLFAFRKDISMNNKDRKRQIAYEVLMILGSLALLTLRSLLWYTVTRPITMTGKIR